MMTCKPERKGTRIVLFISGLGNGGAERVFVRLREVFEAEGCFVHLLAATRKGALVDRIPNIDFLESKFALFSLFHYMKFLKTTKPDIVIATLSSAIIVAALEKSLRLPRRESPKLICREANILERGPGIKGALKFWTRRLALNQADALIANSQATLDSIFSIIDPSLSKIPHAIIPNPVLPDDYIKIRETLKLKLSSIEGNISDEYKIVIIGRLVPQKRIDHGIEVYKRVEKVFPNSALLIIGDGPLKDDLVRHAKKLSISAKIKFIPFSESIPSLLVSSNCFISVSRYEGFGNVFVEALAYCKNIVAYRNRGGSDELLPQTDAVLIQDGNIEKMAAAVIDRLSDPKQADLYPDDLLKNYTSRAAGSTYIKFIKSIGN